MYTFQRCYLLPLTSNSRSIISLLYKELNNMLRDIGFIYYLSIISLSYKNIGLFITSRCIRYKQKGDLIQDQ